MGRLARWHLAHRHLVRVLLVLFHIRSSGKYPIFAIGASFQSVAVDDTPVANGFISGASAIGSRGCAANRLAAIRPAR